MKPFPWWKKWVMTAWLAMAVAWPALVGAQDTLQVVKVVLAEPQIRSGGEQLLQVSLRNRSGKTIRAGLRAEIRLGKTSPTGISKQRVVSIPPFAEQRIFFPLKAPVATGQYNTRVVVLSPDFRTNLLSGSPEFFSPFEVSGNSPLESPPPDLARTEKAAGGRITGFTPPRGLKFEKPDLLWENFSVTPSDVLIGEPLKVRADLRNVGGDIARDISVAVQYINLRLPTQPHSIASSKVAVLAPGEKVEMEFEHPFDEQTLLGEYRVILLADTERKVAESNEDNNRRETSEPIKVATIRLVFPDPGFIFEETGVFLFRWDSRKYNEFKVQVGTDPNFGNKENFFDIPQGEKWSTDSEVAPLEGELPGMLKGLLLKTKSEFAHWRVVGRVADTDTQGFSQVRKFRMNITLPVDEPPPGEKNPAAVSPERGASASPARGLPPPSGGRPIPALPPPGT